MFNPTDDWGPNDGATEFVPTLESKRAVIPMTQTNGADNPAFNKDETVKKDQPAVYIWFSYHRLSPL